MSTTNKKKVTPLMKQYQGIKSKYPDAILLFRVGDFYETFGQDAIVTASILNIVLTKRGNGSEKDTALAGFPHHSLQTYLPKLVTAGHRVAICDQLEDPKLTKTIVKRGVTELITPGVVLSDQVLESKTNNYLAALHYDKKFIGLSFLDISTGEFWLTQGDLPTIQKLISNFAPREVLVSKPFKKRFFEDFPSDLNAYFMESWAFQKVYTDEVLQGHFKVNSLKGFGVEELSAAKVASGVILHYLKETHHQKLGHIHTLKRILNQQYVWMDTFTLQSLELVNSTHSSGISLLDVIDKTKSPMGARMLKHWLQFPLKDITAIQKRLDTVSSLLSCPIVLSKLQDHLATVGDVERLAAKTATAKISPRELVQLQKVLAQLPEMLRLLESTGNKELLGFIQGFKATQDVVDLIGGTLDADAPVSIGKGITIKKGKNKTLDELRDIASSSKLYLDQLIENTSQQTGITSLKIGSNNVFGYYIEVRNTHKDKVPKDWIRKQTLVSAERYITEELKVYESKILGAEDRILSLEQEIFQELLQELQIHISDIQHNAKVLAKLDVLLCFAHISDIYNYSKPSLSDDGILDIKQARHPVIERQLDNPSAYVPNDIYLDDSSQQIMMITGPNMSGKSAILRQTALTVILAQIGCFVPAKSADIGVVDKIFTRVGASDNISLGESTFMVEMNETASILNNLSNRSLLLMDEIGRGTSTYDGISIAWGITQYLHEHPARPKTLFATHYHELNQMEKDFERIENYNVAVKELSDDVLFLRKLVKGGSDHSFGIHVAKMAGIPKEVVHISKEVLSQLEVRKQQQKKEEKIDTPATDENYQLSFIQLDDPLLEEVKASLLAVDVDQLTPVEALMKLNELKYKLTSKKNKK